MVLAGKCHPQLVALGQFLDHVISRFELPAIPFSMARLSTVQTNVGLVNLGGWCVLPLASG